MLSIQVLNRITLCLTVIQCQNCIFNILVICLIVYACFSYSKILGMSWYWYILFRFTMTSFIIEMLSIGLGFIDRDTQKINTFQSIGAIFNVWILTCLCITINIYDTSIKCNKINIFRHFEIWNVILNIEMWKRFSIQKCINTF